MKSIILSLFVVTFFLASCAEDKPIDTLIFSGNVENTEADSLVITDSFNDNVAIIYCDRHKSFADTLLVKEGVYWMAIGEEQTKVYLKPGMNFEMRVNATDFDETIHYKGNGAIENNYLASKALLEEGYGKLRSYRYYGALEEVGFLQLTDSLHKVNLDLLFSFKDSLDKEFYHLESESLEYEKRYKISDYEGMHQWVTESPDFVVSSSFPKPFKKINKNNEDLLKSSSYTSFLNAYVRSKASERIKVDSSIDSYLAQAQIINEEFENVNVKENLAYSLGKWNLGYTKELDKLFNLIQPLLTNKAKLEKVGETYNKLKKIEKGAVSPTFAFNSIDNKLVSLESLKGKLVYIDIWATWCGPCISEIPDLKKIEEEFHGKNIHFVSICMNDSKESWEKMVEEKELGGIQLFAEDGKHSFFQDYVVTGIPRFILLNEEGKIIDAKAKRPSDSELKRELDALL